MLSKNNKDNKLSTLFLDRDGVINYKQKGYIKSYTDFKFIEGVQESISRLNILFERIIIVTNQQGIDKRLMSSIDLDILHSKMIKEIENYGGVIDKIYYCPHLLSADCKCRKPKPGMLVSAKNDFPDIDFKRSVLIGDSDTDILAAESVGVFGVRVSKSYTLSDWTNEFSISLN